MKNKATKIAILTLENDQDFFSSSVLLRYLAEIWQQQGFSVQVVRGINQKVSADIVVSHIDLTIVPDAYRRYLADYSTVINGAALNISKTIVSQHLLTMDDRYEGPVIVKTAANYGGIPEQIWAKSRGLSHDAAVIERPWRRVQCLDSYHYPIFDAMQDVPYGVWRNDKLVVEKFLPEVDGHGDYRLRTWFVMGDQDIGKFEASRQPIVKDGTFKKEILTEVPEELIALRRRLGIDFARFDYAIVDGQAVIYDVNTTPTIGANTLALIAPYLEKMAAGIQVYY